MKIGITILIKSPTESFFSNGIKQNAIIMRDTLLAIDGVKEVYYINLGSQKDLSQSPWKEYEPYIINFEDALDKVNVISCVCASLSDEMAQKAHKKGIKLVHHIMGNEYYSFVETILFNREDKSIVEKQNYFDAVWISPHLIETNKDLFEIIYNCPAYEAAYLWSPQFLYQHVEALKNKDGITGLYAHKEAQNKKICVFEPNLSFVKNCMFSIIIGEKLELMYPDLLDSLNLFGSDGIKSHKALYKFVKHLNIQKNKKIFFESRFPIAWSLFNHTDIMLAHQQHCGLNYAYFDAAWLGFPVIHNSKFIKKLGWYYNQYDADMAVEQIKNCIEEFKVEKNRNKYFVDSRKFILKYLPTDKNNVNSYKNLLNKLF